MREPPLISMARTIFLNRGFLGNALAVSSGFFFFAALSCCHILLPYIESNKPGDYDRLRSPRDPRNRSFVDINSANNDTLRSSITERISYQLFD
jgi:hypothetical protein